MLKASDARAYTDGLRMAQNYPEKMRNGNFRRVPYLSHSIRVLSLFWRVSSLVDFFFVIRGNKSFKCLALIADTANFPGTILSWLLRGWFSRVLWCKPVESS